MTQPSSRKNRDRWPESDPAEDAMVWLLLGSLLLSAFFTLLPLAGLFLLAWWAG